MIYDVHIIIFESKQCETHTQRYRRNLMHINQAKERVLKRVFKNIAGGFLNTSKNIISMQKQAQRIQ